MFPNTYYGNRGVILALCSIVNNKFYPEALKAGYRSRLKRIAKFYGWTDCYHPVWADEPALLKNLAPILFNNRRLPHCISKATQKATGKTLTGNETNFIANTAGEFLNDHLHNSYSSLTNYRFFEVMWVFLCILVLLTVALITL